MTKFIPLLIFAALSWFLYDGLGRDTKTIPSPLIGKKFPDLLVEDFHTKEKYTTQSQLKNRLTLVNVWASWCVTCRAEHQMLMALARQNLLPIIGVNYKDTRQAGQIFLNKLGNPYQRIIFDKQGKLGLELGVYATPETFLVDAQGIIRFKRIGQLTPNIWQTQILPLIQQLKMKN